MIANMNGPRRDGVKECKRKNGDIVRFDPATTAFGTKGTNGSVYTYMLIKPPYNDGLTPEKYFEIACRK
jgi:hypothetical protein